MEGDWRQVLVLMPMNPPVLLHVLQAMAPDVMVMGSPSLGQATKEDKCGKIWELINGTKLTHNPLACFLHNLSAPAHLDHPETTVHFLNQMFLRESWLLLTSCSLRLSQSNVLQLWWRNKRKILSLKCCGEAHSGTLRKHWEPRYWEPVAMMSQFRTQVEHLGQAV